MSAKACNHDCISPLRPPQILNKTSSIDNPVCRNTNGGWPRGRRQLRVNKGYFMPKKTGVTHSVSRAAMRIRPQKLVKAATRNKKLQPKSFSVQPTREAIARRAYELWQAAFARANQSSQHWLKAESQLRAELKKSTRGRRATAAGQATHEMIACRAYGLWQTAVRCADEPSQHWHEAESQLRQELKRSGRFTRSATSLSHEMVAHRAYHMWQNAVRIANEPSHHWFEAEAQLRAELKKTGQSNTRAGAGRRPKVSKSTAAATTSKRSARRLAA